MEAITVKLSKRGQEPLYQQIYRFMAEEIQSGRVSPGERLPSKRSMCQHLGVSQSTVETAYGLLLAEGYIMSSPKRGYFACDLMQPIKGPEPSPPIASPREDRQEEYLYDFSTGAVDTSAFPYATWAKITKETVYESPSLLQRGDKQGDLPLRRTLCSFLREFRGVRCSPEQIIVGAGMEYLLSVLLSLFLPDTLFALEDPGYPAVYELIINSGRRVQPIPLTEQGMDVTSLKKSRAKVAFVTPSHQFPTGVTIPVGRRTQLLRWAQEVGGYIIEDDYDSEFRYSSRPLPAMQGLDQTGRVVYIATFSRSIAPSIRDAYMVLPAELLQRYLKMFSHSSSTVSRLEQETLRRFIAGGMYTRHLRRVGNLYRQKQQRLTEALQGIPGAQVWGNQAGLHLLVTLPGKEEGFLISSAAKIGIKVRGLSQYSRGTACRPGTVVLGFAGLSLEDIERAARLLKKAWTEAEYEGRNE